ncbi:MAG: hypothetical protein ACLSDJ_08915 [Butyricimonas faecihominis]
MNTYNKIETAFDGKCEYESRWKEVLLKPNQKGVLIKHRVKSRWRMDVLAYMCVEKRGFHFPE